MKSGAFPHSKKLPKFENHIDFRFWIALDFGLLVSHFRTIRLDATARITK
ncbi:hypothetical protein O77CONTIG1_00775 [Leptolyngbya sp. O-77]|nr:hypothetical protein O77CONTIG1_00775 [Leptolyngbya sp. O-77]